MKTLADLCKENGILSYAKLCDPPIPCYEGTAKQWESVVQAVREAVIEECAKVCEDTFIDYINGDDDSSGFSIYGDKCAKELRQMIKKDKK